MDPRHPEQAVSRMIELMAQFSGVENTMKKATTSAELANLEREASLVIQEICLVAPRLHEAMMQTSRMRRADLAKGYVNEIEKKVDIEKPDVNEIHIEPNQAEVEIVEPKPRKKKSTKKKAKK